MVRYRKLEMIAQNQKLLELVRKGLAPIFLRDIFSALVRFVVTIIAARNLTSSDFSSYILICLIAAYADAMFRFKTDQSVGFFGSVPIVAGTVPLAVGAAMAARLSGQSDVSIAYLGDGALEEGVVHESLNLAAINQEPIIFVVENNLFASHMHIS